MGNTVPFSASQAQALALVPKGMANLSMMGSVFIMQDVLRDKKRRGKVQFRILLLMSLFDFVFSTKNFLSTWIVPGSSGVYLASGTIQTCTAAGFFGQLGTMTSIFYNASLSIYFLMTIRYN